MRWTVCVVAVGLGLVPMTSRAEEAVELETAKEGRSTLVMALPLSGLSSQVGAGVEQAISPHVALAGAVSTWGSFSRQYAYIPVERGLPNHHWGVGVDAGVHFYLTGRAPEGFWVGPHVEMSMTRQYTENLLAFSGGGLAGANVYAFHSRRVDYGGSMRLGYTAIVGPGLTVQVGVGLAALSSRNSDFTPTIVSTGEGEPRLGIFASSPPRSWSVAPRMTVGLGWAL
ncbi:hypothetical protein JQX13_12110 [Archangium violaceum]|uniref:hypothetical protein n=1 Tax=Archangium violaceum TaxID=83451 RepID=UPI00193C4CAD|nr:hypothetical protein [Archangium violaceum]QRK10744.1 hypothetical protein JQX13_12110 [Archangium violaceum]